MSPICVLLVDDNVALCTSVARWLSSEPGFGAAACQSDWRRALESVHETSPDVVLLDIDLPGTSGLDLIPSLRAARPGVKVVMFSGLASRGSVERALDNGADGYIVKDQEAPVIAELVRRVAGGEVALCPIATAALMGPAGAG